MTFNRTTIIRLLALLALAVVLLSSRQLTGAARAQQSDTPLIVATKPLEPFVYLNGPEPTGFSIDLWAEIANRLDLTYDWLPFETVSEILTAVETGEADVAIAGVSMTRDREARLDFTHPFFDAGLQIMTADDGSFSLPDLLRQVFSPGLLWFLALGLLAALVMAHIIYFIERRSDPDFPDGYLAGMWESIWYLLGMVANGEHPDKYTRNPVRRLLVIGFWLIGLLLVAQFTATVTSSLTVQRLNSAIQGPDDLPGKTIATVSGSTAADYLRSRGIDFTTVELIEEAYPMLTGGTVDAIVYDAPVLRYYSVTRGQGQVQVVGVIFRPEKYGIALAQGSELREPINEVLLEMYQDGTLEVIYDRWFGS
jgi:ABC-type amino acid transport substrate-binding protein